MPGGEQSALMELFYAKGRRENRWIRGAFFVSCISWVAVFIANI